MHSPKIVLFVTVLMLCACSNHHDELLGTWALDSKHYSATYVVEEVNDDLAMWVLYYDDGTTRYKWENGEKQFAYKSLQYSDGIFFDGSTGATQKGDKAHQLSLKSPDTLIIQKPEWKEIREEVWLKVYD